ncbi:protein FAR1-RELATED SEQUENCE 5-like [Salvia miltiorrhiza]|uniref:protein FAR1-RELATED SEQUENCE 5-like n=1 Tax=Salvia miltiorrhiza TaxID=226208 RepID=UPI0025ABC5F3|nr:protein FAR1-RELATED SEQUENCE 5-like [Salvia miltiorrhiza]
MRASGIGVSRAYRFLEKEAGSRENIGFIRKDIYNELQKESRKVSKINDGDANKLLEMLTDRGMSDPSFFWKVKLSDDGRLKNLFFRDTRCLVDYQHFGDVLSVDATYKTNKYDLICVPMIGINHHRTNVMFGLGFLSNEKAESYEWLFSTFLQAMYHKEPSTIFSDQDMAIMNAIDSTFRESSHRLCQWHINKNAVKHFGKLNHDKDFKNLWHRCMNGCESGEQFDIVWRRMIDEHNLSEHKWFLSMHKLRKRWSSAFTRDKFSGGLHATSRSEVTNKVLKELCSTTSTLHEFVVGFEKMQKSWRTREFEEDALCRGMPGMFVQRTRILIQVGEVCTRSVFKMFEYEALNCISVDLTESPPDLNEVLLEFKLSSSSSGTGYRLVKYNQNSKFASCCCHLWETEGIICRHLFRVYLHFNQHSVPDEMLLNRWRKDSKQRIGLSDRLSESAGVNKLNSMVFVNHNTKIVYDLLTECKDDRSCRDFIDDSIGRMVDGVKSMRLHTMHDTTDNATQEGFKEPLVRPIKNPVFEKKRPYRRMRFSKDREAPGYYSAHTSTTSQDDDENDVRTRRTNFGDEEGLFRSLDDISDRFSME